MDKRIIIIDGNSLINRAYYAMQRPMITKDGVYTQGIYGFINMLNKINKDYPSGYMVVTFDLKAPTFRHLEYEEYKAGRKKMPVELAMQMPILKDILRAMNIKIVEEEGFEADDLIGTIARVGEEEGLEPLIITGDRDALQLATDKTKVLITKKGITNFDLFDHDSFVAEYGFTPTEFIDYKGLMGDKSDNIPGVPGVGEKTASKLILEYKTMENIIENVENITPKGLKKKIEDNIQLALMSKKLATINRFVPIDIDFEMYKIEEPNTDELIKLYKKLEFNSFLKSLSKTSPKEADGQMSLTGVELVTSLPVEIIEGEAEVNRALGLIEEGKSLGIKSFGDSNHLDRPSFRALALNIEDKVYYIKDNLDIVLKKLEETKVSLYGHDIKEDIYLLMHYGNFDFNVEFDTAVCEYVIDSSKKSYELDLLGTTYFEVNLSFDEMMDQKEEQLGLFDVDKSKEDAKLSSHWFGLVKSVRKVQEAKLKEDNLESIFKDVELPLVQVMAYLEYVGFEVDQEELKSQGVEINEKINQLTEKIYQLAGEEFNINSPSQLGPILFEKLELKGGKKTKRGYSTSADILEKIKDDHEIIPLILEYRTLTKLRGTYIDGLIPLIGQDNRIHAKFNQTVTTTGRISSSEPNLQNIPVRTELGRRIRKAFVPAEGSVLIGADYSQIELRVLAHMSGDELLIDSFKNGLDIHKATASRVLGIPEEEITALQRSRAKAINFGVIYGMSTFGLSEELSITRKEADKYIKDYFEKHQAVKDFMDGQVLAAKTNGYVNTILGRKRFIKEITASNYMVRQLGERLAMNTPIQGSAADIIKLAMIKVYDALKGYKSRLILQVHDELIIEADLGEVDKVKEILRESMESALKLSVDLKVSLNEGENWFELK